MARIKEFEATGSLRTNDNGYAAFETLGRRVGGQYNQAGNDIRDIGRAKSDVINMLGRWPFNIIDLQQRETKRRNALLEAESSRATNGGRGGVGGVVSRGSGSGITDDQFKTRRMPNLAALNQMSEGAAYFGRMVNPISGEKGLATSTQSNRDGYSAQVLRERERLAQLDYLARKKSWEEYEKKLDTYNEGIDKRIENYTNQASVSGSYGSDYGGTSTSSSYYPENTTVEPLPSENVDFAPTDYGGGGGWFESFTTGPAENSYE